MKLLFIGMLCGGLFSAQAQSEGMLPRWEVIELSKGVVGTVEQAELLLKEIKPAAWVQSGAPQAYVEQYSALQDDLNNLRLSAEALGRTPEKLTVVIDTFLWLDRVGSMVGSMAGGVRVYQNPSVADLLDTARGNSDAAANTLKEYMRQLAAEREAAMEIANSEAQRCRERLVSQPRR